MSVEPPMPSSLPSQDAHMRQPWMRLYRNGKRVGYARHIRAAHWLYSTDGYGWSSQEIASDRKVAQIPAQLHSQRVFHGDLVLMAAYSGAQSLREKIVLLGSDQKIYLCNVDDMAINALEELWPPPSRPRVSEIRGSVLQDLSQMKVIERRLAMTSGRDPLYHLKLLMLTMAIGVGMGLAGLVQKIVLQHVGPLSVMGGGFLGALLFWWALRAWDWHALRRKVILKMSFHAALLLSGIGCLLFPFFNSDHLLEWSSMVTFIHMIAGGTLGFLAGLLCGLIAAEIVTWRTGGYAGEPRQPLGFRAS